MLATAQESRLSSLPVEDHEEGRLVLHPQLAQSDARGDVGGEKVLATEDEPGKLR